MADALIGRLFTGVNAVEIKMQSNLARSRRKPTASTRQAGAFIKRAVKSQEGSADGPESDADRDCKGQGA